MKRHAVDIVLRAFLPVILACAASFASCWAAEPLRVRVLTYRTKIDYVFFRPAAGWGVVEQQVIDEPVASDHRPLLVVLE